MNLMQDQHGKGGKFFTLKYHKVVHNNVQEIEHSFASSMGDLLVPMNGLLVALRNDVLAKMTELREAMVKGAEQEPKAANLPTDDPHR